MLSASEEEHAFGNRFALVMIEFPVYGNAAGV